MSQLTSLVSLAPSKTQKNLVIKFQENTQIDGRIEEQTQFHTILAATAGVLTSTTTVDWHLKVKDVEYDVGLTKNYCITDVTAIPPHSC